MRFLVSGKSSRALKARKRDIYGGIISQSISDIFGRLRKYFLTSPLLPNLPPFSFSSKLRVVNITTILEGFSAPEPGGAELESPGVG